MINIEKIYKIASRFFLDTTKKKTDYRLAIYLFQFVHDCYVVYMQNIKFTILEVVFKKATDISLTY